MRRMILAVIALSLAGRGSVLAITAPAPVIGGVQYRSAAEVDAVRAAGETGGPVITDTDFRVLAVRRDKPGEAEVHITETDIFFVIDGKATIVVGGEMIAGRTTAPGELRGSGITGGKEYLLEPGIVLTIPGGTPHWIRETTLGFRYAVVKTRVR